MSSQQQRREPWRNAERHYCRVCNAWMGSDRQSIMLHENGKKHKENLERSLQKKRSDKLQREKELKTLQASLQQMEQAAAQSHLAQDTQIASHMNHTPSLHPSLDLHVNVSKSSGQHPQTNHSRTPAVPALDSVSETKIKWTSRKRKQKQHPPESDEPQDAASSQGEPKRRVLRPGEGHYEYDGHVYLEATAFFDILEPELPVQLWVGSLLATAEEKRLSESDMHWEDAIIVTVRKTSDFPTLHVAFLSPGKDEEILEKNVQLGRIRIVLGSHENIPDTLEEARLLQIGGEEVYTVDSVGEGASTCELDDATGLSGWSAVSVRRTTVRRELMEERARNREKKREKDKEEEVQQKQVEARRLEEAKVADADDSALGAYDVWGTGGYKGVDIAGADDIKTVAEMVKGLGKSRKAVAFKKKKRPSSNRRNRMTSAEDD